MSIATYKDKALCLARVTERTGNSDATFIEELLEITAGTLDDVPFYRPYWVSAEILDQNRTVVEKADGVTFRVLSPAVRRMMFMQTSIDGAAGAVIPEEFTLEYIDNEISAQKFSPTGTNPIVST